MAYPAYLLEFQPPERLGPYLALAPPKPPAPAPVSAMATARQAVPGPAPAPPGSACRKRKWELFCVGDAEGGRAAADAGDRRGQAVPSVLPCERNLAAPPSPRPP